MRVTAITSSLKYLFINPVYIKILGWKEAKRQKEKGRPRLAPRSYCCLTYKKEAVIDSHLECLYVELRPIANILFFFFSITSSLLCFHRALYKLTFREENPGSFDVGTLLIDTKLRVSP
ncbi:hypothetical protein C4544_01625 [candidate division WS5 bacterium]|uniref:Uncharacterized protein n=1 Tax=candidate division WS5 bacterium TaxID=2093353 RepID=A0A419DFK4_9BACT|nr:MAG: hypothetical protein C4544_01625 [candidate division WS5 bacterium]